MKIQAYNSNINKTNSFKGRQQDALVVLVDTNSQNALTPVRHPNGGLNDADLLSVLGKTFKNLFSPETTKRAREINKNLDAIVNASFDEGNRLDIQI